MKHKVADLEGAPLDAAVAKAEGYGAPVLFEADHFGEGEEAALWFPHPTMPPFPVGDWCPSSAWVQGGPIIERERIGIIPQDRVTAVEGYEWKAQHDPDVVGIVCAGQTALIASMRAYVASRFGEEVELP